MVTAPRSAAGITADTHRHPPRHRHYRYHSSSSLAPFITINAVIKVVIMNTTYYYLIIIAVSVCLPLTYQVII